MSKPRKNLDTDRVTKIAKALSDITRCRMVERIRATGEVTCSDLCAMFSSAQPTISHHVKTLAEAGIITLRKDGPFHVLSLRDKTLQEFAAAVSPATGGPVRTRLRKRPGKASGVRKTK